ncbi:MAG TPA: cytochrome d ubiquinol oxidase subunit II [Bryobacteraceae bacterium]|nr:cytochrome d ubiquinol oxidase subunit II [Bryobacteraceae bacterium]
METVWFWLVAVLIAGYVLLDGFDLGAGALHLFLAKNDTERTQVLDSIGPFWDGNEVWLLAGGGTLYFAFPALYASAFSGFYLPLMVVLWLFILRGISIESRHLMHNSMWCAFWDTVFCGASALLIIFFGAALGNVVRGVPHDANHEFFLPFWTDFRVSPNPGVLDWYTVLIGLLALAALLQHGALWLAYRTHPPLENRASAAARTLWFAVAALTPLATIASGVVRPGLFNNLDTYPIGFLLPALAIAGLVWIRKAASPLSAFLGSCAYLAGMLTSAVFSVYPSVLPAMNGPGLTIYNASAPRYGLEVGLLWWLPAFFLACAYAAFLYRRFAGKVDKPAA